MLLVFSAGVLTVLLFVFNIHWRFGGHTWETFKPGWVFGVNQKSGMYPTYASGWDGQFYYALSNDPLLRDPETFDHLDNPAYRLQRTFVPLLIFLGSRALGFEVTPPWFYHLVQFLIVLMGLYHFMRVLEKRGVPPSMALTWFFGGAMLPFLFAGMLDGVAESFLILTLAMWERKNLILFTLAATALLLTRESYVLFLMGLLVVSWRRYPSARYAFLLPFFALAAMQLWTSSKALAWQPHYGKALSLIPFSILFKLKTQFESGNFKEVACLLFVITLLAVTVWKGFKGTVISRAYLFYLPLFLFFVDSNWAAAGIYLRFLGSTIIILVWCYLDQKRSAIVVLLFLNVIVGTVAAVADRDSPDLRYEIEHSGVKDYRQWGGSPSQCLGKIAGTLEIRDSARWYRKSQWLWTREFRRVPIYLKNTGKEKWSRSHPYWNHSFYLTYRWTDPAGRMVTDGQRIAVPFEVAPGAEADGVLSVKLPSPGYYHLDWYLFQNRCEPGFHLATQGVEVSSQEIS